MTTHLHTRHATPDAITSGVTLTVADVVTTSVCVVLDASAIVSMLVPYYQHIYPDIHI
jgi:hypothetical protein